MRSASLVTSWPLIVPHDVLHLQTRLLRQHSSTHRDNELKRDNQPQRRNTWTSRGVYTALSTSSPRRLFPLGSISFRQGFHNHYHHRHLGLWQVTGNTPQTTVTSLGHDTHHRRRPAASNGRCWSLIRAGLITPIARSKALCLPPCQPHGCRLLHARTPPSAKGTAVTDWGGVLVIASHSTQAHNTTQHKQTAPQITRTQSCTQSWTRRDSHERPSCRD